MLPGPDEVIACPYCSELVVRGTLKSGNTFGAVVWTDGRRVAPMLPDQPFITRCLGCEKIFWLEDAEVIDSLEPFTSTGSTSLPRVGIEGGRLLYDAIKESICRSSEEELTLYLEAWWASNDRFRVDEAGDIKGDPVRRPQELEVMTWLLDNLNVERSEDVLMRAELARELGRWEQANSELDQCEIHESLMSVARQIRRLIAAQNSFVRPIEFDDELSQTLEDAQGSILDLPDFLK